MAVKISIKNKDDKQPVLRLGKVFPPKSETVLEVSETDYRILKAVRRLEVREVTEKAPVKNGKAPRASAKVQGTGSEPAAGAKAENAGEAGSEKVAGRSGGKKAADEARDTKDAGSTGDKE